MNGIIWLPSGLMYTYSNLMPVYQNNLVNLLLDGCSHDPKDCFLDFYCDVLDFVLHCLFNGQSCERSYK